MRSYILRSIRPQLGGADLFSLLGAEEGEHRVTVTAALVFSGVPVLLEEECWESLHGWELGDLVGVALLLKHLKHDILPLQLGDLPCTNVLDELLHFGLDRFAVWAPVGVDEGELS